MLFNYVLEAAILANVLAQLIKLPLRLIIKKEWNPGIIFSTGGMPSSHAAFVMSLTTAVAISEGTSSTLFAMSFCFAAVVIYDAMGIRRHAGQHAAMLNQLIEDLREAGDLSIFQDVTYQKRFKELLGHEPLETFAGTIFGIVVAVCYGSMLGII